MHPLADVEVEIIVVEIIEIAQRRQPGDERIRQEPDENDEVAAKAGLAPRGKIEILANWCGDGFHEGGRKGVW